MAQEVATPFLSELERAWLRAFLLHGNKTQAVIDAGFEVEDRLHAAAMGASIARRQSIREALADVQSRLEEDGRFAPTPENIMRELAAVAFSRVTDFVRIAEDGRPELDLSRMDHTTSAAIASIEPSEYGHKVKVHDKLKALEIMAKVHGMLKDVKVDISFDEIQERIAAGRARLAPPPPIDE